MHSSRMHTGRTLTVFRSLLSWRGVWSWGVYLPGPGGGYLPCPGGEVSGLGGVPAWSGGGTYLVWGGSGPGGCLVPGGLVWGGVWSRGVPAWSQGVHLPDPRGGTCLVLGGVECLVRYSPPVDRMTHACENITLAKTSFRPVKIYK